MTQHLNNALDQINQLTRSEIVHVEGERRLCIHIFTVTKLSGLSELRLGGKHSDRVGGKISLTICTAEANASRVCQLVGLAHMLSISGVIWLIAQRPA